MDRTLTDPVIGTYTLVKSRRARQVSIRVHPVKGVVVTVPYWVPYRVGSAFLAARRDWVAAALDRQRKRLEKAVTEGKALPPDADREALVKEWRKQAKAILPDRLSTLAQRYGFRYGKVFIKHNSSNWGSCSARGNINLNLNLIRLPEPLRDYVMLHELAHLTHPDHGPGFHALLERLCLDCTGCHEKELAKEVKSYRLA